MKYSTRLSDGVHILIFMLLNPGAELTSDAIALSIRTNPAFVRQMMSLLKKGGLINCVKGKPRPTLAKSPEEITLFDVYKAVEGDKPLLHLDTHTNPECRVGLNIQYSLMEYYKKKKKSAEDTMKNITLKDIADNYFNRTGKEE